MVEADGGRSNKLYLAVLEQLLVAASASPDDECVGIPDVSGPNLSSTQRHHLVCQKV